MSIEFPLPVISRVLTFQVLGEIVVFGLFGYLLRRPVVFVHGQKRRAGRYQQVADLSFAV